MINLSFRRYLGALSGQVITEIGNDYDDSSDTDDETVPPPKNVDVARQSIDVGSGSGAARAKYKGALGIDTTDDESLE